MHFRSFRLVLISVILAAVVGSAGAADYFPLFDGRSSTYRGFHPIEGDYYYTMQVTPMEPVDGTMRYEVAYTGMPDFTSMIAAKADGALMVYGYVEEGTTFTLDTPVMYLPANPTLGMQWTYMEDGALRTNTVLAIETVTTPAGTFPNCIKVKRQRLDNYQLHWYAPNVGEVKFYDEGGSEPEMEEIVSFTQFNSCDDTPPSVPVISGDSPDSYGNAMHGVWTSSDPESGVVEYQIAVSTTPSELGMIQEIGWNSQAGMTATASQGMGEFVQDGGTYYALARARNGAGLWSDVGVSGPITVRLSPLGTSPWPMEVGNIWRYQIHSSETGDRVGSLSVTGSTQVDGQTRYVVCEGQGYYKAENEPQQMTAAWTSGEMRLYSFDGQSVDPPLVLARDPLVGGDNWTCEDFGGGITRFEVLAVDQTVMTPAGTFTGCIKVGQKWDNHLDSLDYFWYKPGVGLVQSDSYEDYNWSTPKEHRVLTDWHVSPGPTDVTPPPTPAVADDGSNSYGNGLHATWVCSDPESAILDYQVAVSTTPSEAGIIPDAPWRSTCGSNSWTSQFPSGIQYGGTYYILVKALNSAGLWSTTGASDGIIVHKSVPSNDFWPLHPANRWQYIKQDILSGLESRFTTTVAVADALALEVTNLRGMCDRIVCGSYEDGFYLYATDDHIYDPEWRQLVYPLTEGQQNTRDGMTVTVEGLHDTVSVAAGTFEGCVRLRIDSPDGMTMLDWFAPGVGMVQEEVYQDEMMVSTQSMVGYYLRSTDSITEVKEGCDGSPVALKGAIVSAAWPDAFYVESDTRNCGIRVEMSEHLMDRWDRVELYGVLKTNEAGERYIDASAAATMGTGSVSPLGILNRWVGGANWRHSPLTKTGQRGISGGVGLNNVGLLVWMYGYITQTDPSPDPRWFILRDGSDVDIRCEIPDGMPFDPSQWQNEISVTGISSLYLDGSTVKSRILIRDSGDIIRLRIAG